MKILFYCNVSPETVKTVEFYRQDIMALRDAGHEVTVCTSYRQLFQYFDVIFIWWWSYALIPVLLAKFFRKRSIITGTFNFKHDLKDSAYDYFTKTWWQRCLIYFSVKLTDLNIFVSEKEFVACKDYFKIKHADLLYHSVGEEYQQKRNHLQDSVEPFLFNLAWSGLLNLDRKGVFIFLDAIKLLQLRGNCCKVVLAGRKGDGVNALKIRIKELGLEDNVEYLGEISKKEKLRYLRTCSLYVQPSKFEGFGLALAEAMASEAPCIVTPVGALPEVVGESGFYVEPNSPERLADEIERLMKLPQELELTGRKAAERVRHLFSFERKVEYFKDLESKLNTL